MIGRHNVTLYVDELERAQGGIRIMLESKRGDMSPVEHAYWLGASAVLNQIRLGDLQCSWEQFLSAMKLHFEGDGDE